MPSSFLSGVLQLISSLTVPEEEKIYIYLGVLFLNFALVVSKFRDIILTPSRRYRLRCWSTSGITWCKHSWQR